MQKAVKAQNYNKPQINADERRFVHRVHLRLIDHLTPQRTRRTQSIATMFFATFALFAVGFLQRPDRLLDTTVNRVSAFICVHLRLIIFNQKSEINDRHFVFQRA